jgi:hypothetical protein
MVERAAARELDEPAPASPAARDSLGVVAAPPPRQRLTIRRRRLRRAMITVAMVAGAGLALAGWLALRARPTTRVPGEALPEITDRLARPLPAGAPEPAFADVTAAAGLGDFVSFAGERSSQLPEDMGAGAAWGDYDGDGDSDLFVVAAGGPMALPAARRAPSRLYENLGAGRFRAAPGFPATRILGMGAAWGDAEGDGDLDLAVTGYDALLLFLNQGGGSFVRDERFASLPGFWSGAAWGDFDRDGDLDLYVCGYVQYAAAAAGAPPPAALLHRPCARRRHAADAERLGHRCADQHRRRDRRAARRRQ